MESEPARRTTRMACSAIDSTKLERWIASKAAAGDDAFASEPLVEAVEGFVRCPSLEALGKFLDSRARRFARKGLRVVDARLESVSVVPHGDGPAALEGGLARLDLEAEPSRAGKGALVRVKLSDGSTLLASQVVVADTGTCAGRANVPAFVGRIGMASCASGGGAGWHEAIAYAESDLDLSKSSDYSGKTICIVGGGITSVHLADKALHELGVARIHLISRGKMDGVKKFDVDVGWLGKKNMKAFLEEMGPWERLRACRHSAGKSTLSPRAKGTLDRLLQEPAFALLTETVVSTAAWRENKWTIQVNNSCDAISCDQIWVACGRSFDCLSELVVQDLQEVSKARICGAYPLLDSATLAWPGIPNVMFMGTTAALALGPSAKYPSGFRAASEKIARALENPSAPASPLDFEDFVSSGELLCEGEGPNNGRWDESAKPSMLEESPIKQRLCNSSQGLEKCTIESYTWSDSDFEIDIYVKLNEPVEKEDVLVDIGDQALEVLAETKGRIYYLNLEKLYKPVQVKKSTYRVFEKKGKIVVRLTKCDNHEWKFLKG
ncbi:hypothetical protein A3770_06p41940 [Chloropicon primus]|uniref:CS domain-containing protein n=1 Tax=Chloropicon primus TaxID=1764295 RepID=A0A5B8MMB3_9CHLO|nr:hypothetical protein A3770_06p41940 [Chloropicon primus]|eukprot:QDZ21676.1 hypothetical protein A3770_06p41940 [Chloropicon primus]